MDWNSSVEPVDAEYLRSVRGAAFTPLQRRIGEALGSNPPPQRVQELKRHECRAPVRSQSRALIPGHPLRLGVATASVRKHHPLVNRQSQFVNSLEASLKFGVWNLRFPLHFGFRVSDF
ncbi:MAG: hypothetical protein AB1705_11140 [Verrucomicrobiota bacterium]